MIIKFKNDAIDSYINMLNHLSGWTIEGEFTNSGFPTPCVIMSADNDGMTICEADFTGRPLNPNSTWVVPYDEITAITVL
jgi:hypothetical protein